jgi:hypothetical protein
MLSHMVHKQGHVLEPMIIKSGLDVAIFENPGLLYVVPENDDTDSPFLATR